ncbi:MAG: hypothetical protein IIA88_12260, partial [Bacteroidetes bacterium]|nr:hypothetical protein [Bacteroidota bacterium]
MKNKFLLFTFYFVLFTSNLSAQCPGCIADTSCKINPPYPTLCPDTLPDGRVMIPYDEDISFYLPEEFNAGVNVVFDTLVIDAIYNVPFGLSWESSSPNDKFYPSSNPPATEHGCVKVCGTPLISGTYTIIVFVTVYVDAGIFGTVMQQKTFDIYITILPDTSGNASFAMTNSFGCGSVTTSFQTNFPSNGNPNYSYNWDFGNALTSSAENPPPMTYNTLGTYAVSLQTTIDTLEYTLTSVEVLAADCGDSPWSAPDFYFILYDGATEILNSLATNGSVSNTNPPVSVPFTPINLNNTTYTLEIWDEDGG